jgi:RimJ/RimL family protein N-acetyltransferase
MTDQEQRLMNPMPTLETERLVLRPMVAGDAPEIARLAGERAIARTTLHIPHPYTLEDAQQWIAKHQPRWEQGTCVSLAICLAHTGEMAGSIGITIDATHSIGELGYWIAVQHWGRGYATEAVRAVIEYAFEHFELNRVQAHLFDGNIASQRVLEKVGMTCEGVHRQNVRKWDHFRDTIHYAVLRSEFRPHQP